MAVTRLWILLLKGELCIHCSCQKSKKNCVEYANLWVSIRKAEFLVGITGHQTIRVWWSSVFTLSWQFVASCSFQGLLTLVRIRYNFDTLGTFTCISTWGWKIHQRIFVQCVTRTCRPQRAPYAMPYLYGCAQGCACFARVSLMLTRP
jgi:hypothetical protein